MMTSADLVTTLSVIDTVFGRQIVWTLSCLEFSTCFLNVLERCPNVMSNLLQNSWNVLELSLNILEHSPNTLWNIVRTILWTLSWTFSKRWFEPYPKIFLTFPGLHRMFSNIIWTSLDCLWTIFEHSQNVLERPQTFSERSRSFSERAWTLCEHCQNVPRTISGV